MPHPVVLAATLHDPVGRTAAAMDRLAEECRGVFADIVVNVSDASTPEVIAAARRLTGKMMIHAAGESIIGKARRDAVALAGERVTVLYADLDHMLRWVDQAPDDLRRVLDGDREIDCLVIGRSPRAMAAEPQRLQATEALVNHTFGLLVGGHWDLMFAIRRLSPAAADMVVRESRMDTLANDIEWPLLARRAGLALGYAASDALFYRTIEEFGAAADSGDAEPLQWIRRLEFAGLHASAMRAFLEA